MTIRKIKNKERKMAGNIYCDHCKPAKVDAAYRVSGYASHEMGHFACEEHKHLIIDLEENQHLTAADYQTWMRV